MKKLDTYIAGNFIRVFLVIALGLAVLFSFFEFFAQLEDVGRGQYRILHAVLYVIFTMPKRLLDLMPVSTLLAGIFSLGLMADHNELLAMQAAGISPYRISASAFTAGILLMLSAGLLGEVLVPPTEQKGHMLRVQTLFGKEVTMIGQGIWARQGDRYIHAGKILGKGLAADLDVFEFAPDGRLRVYAHARNAVIGPEGDWTLRGVTRKVITDGKIEIERLGARKLAPFLRADQVRILQLPPYSLSTPDLIRYVQALRQGGQNADTYLLSLWRKFTVPLTTGAMVLLALSFVFGSTRSVTTARRITFGAVAGIALYLGDQVIMDLGLLLNLNPLATAMIPVVLICTAAGWQLRRAR